MNKINIYQIRMETAYDFVKDKIKDKNPAKEFESYVNKLPAYIFTNGIGNTFAYLAAQQGKKENNTWSLVVNAIYVWLKNKESGFNSNIEKYKGNNNIDTILEMTKSLDNNMLLALKEEVLAYINWLRKFAKARKIELEKQSKKQIKNG